MIVFILFFEQEHHGLLFYNSRPNKGVLGAYGMGGRGQGGLGENFLSEFVSLTEFRNLSVLLTSTTHYVIPSTDCKYDLIYK